MAKLAGFSLLALTAACGGAAPVSSNVAEPIASGATPTIANTAAAAPVRTAPESDWAGEYRGQGVTITIKRDQRPGKFEVNIADGNGGGGPAFGNAKGPVLTATLPNGNTADGWKECFITLRQTATGLQVTGNRDCPGVLASGYTLDGSYERIDAGKSAAASEKSGQMTPAMLAGAWVSEGDRCASGSGFIFASDGTYGNTDFEGTWSLRGGQITLSGRAVTLPDEPQEELSTSTFAFRQISRDEIMLGPDRWRRCSPRGGAEPWYPRERFTTS